VPSRGVLLNAAAYHWMEQLPISAPPKDPKDQNS